MAGDEAAVRAAAEEGADPNWRDPDWRLAAPLHKAPPRPSQGPRK